MIRRPAYRGTRHGFFPEYSHLKFYTTMLYFRVKKEFDGRRCSRGVELVRNELFTPREVEKLAICKDFLQPVEVKRNTVYFFFGARFCEAVGYSD